MLLVSIHDVTPALDRNVIRLWQLCRDRGVTPALFVVPNWHGAWPLERHPDFNSWLRDRAAEGAEVALHGDRHDEVGLARGIRDHWKAWGRTDGEGEFLTLDAPAAKARLAHGIRLLREIGLEPVGFVPPAWLAREPTYQAAASLGFRFSEDDRRVRLLATGHVVSSPVVRWSARTRLRAWGSVSVAAARWLFQSGSQCPRIALHPRDLDHRVTARSIGSTLDRWLGLHRPGRYADLSASPGPV
jgi:uncharacterized protein